MATAMADGRGTNGWRVAGWTTAAAVLIAPAVAMRFTDEVQWTALDFGAAALLLGALGGGLEWLFRRGGGAAYRLGAGLAAFATFGLIWVNLAVGIIGSGENDANWLYALVIATVVGGGIVTGGRAAGMARVSLTAAALQVGIAAVAVPAGWGSDGPIWPRDVVGATAILTAMWLAAAWLFARAAGQARR
jgi:hypothetical protein